MDIIMVKGVDVVFQMSLDFSRAVTDKLRLRSNRALLPLKNFLNPLNNFVENEYVEWKESTGRLSIGRKSKGL